ncbi:MAG TPA: YceD family protein [Steroidobacteraceae bacterium]
MSEGWLKLLDIGPLADGHAQIDFTIPLRQFPRVLPLLAAPDGAARGRVDFSREGRIAVAEVTVAADVLLQCQRCLGPVMSTVDSTGRAALVATQAEGARVPQTLETVLAQEYRISLRDLVEEELLLALPLVPRHEDKACAGARAGTPSETHRPFGQLSELLKRQ